MYLCIPTDIKARFEQCVRMLSLKSVSIGCRTVVLVDTETRFLVVKNTATNCFG
eukprot:m.218413 g.218413  ORF g.218413 m.218413 type:complete len:54 (-) comp19153_c0_seq1:1669-1830(-)